MDGFLPPQWCCQFPEEMSEVDPVRGECVAEGYTARLSENGLIGWNGCRQTKNGVAIPSSRCECAIADRDSSAPATNRCVSIVS